MTAPVRVLLIDDDEEDLFITEEHLADAPGEFELSWASKYSEGLSLVEGQQFDICLVDYKIGGETGIEFLGQAAERGVVIPMILLTGVGHRDIDLAASAVGAADFLDKGSLTPVLLERAIRYAIAHAGALRELEEQRNVLETTLESIQGGIIAFDQTGEILAANHQFNELVAGLKVRGATEGADAEEKARRLLSLIVDRGPGQVVEASDDQGRVFEFRLGPAPGGGGVLLAVDVSAQRTLQRRILEAKAAAELANQTKSAFLAKVSHELRTPLNGVFGMAQLIRLGELDERQEQHVDRLLDSAQGLMALIEDLLDISVIEEGRFLLRREEIDPAQLIREAADIASAAAQAVVLEIELLADLPKAQTFVGDGKRIKQILVNLLSNATKFTSAGRITVSVSFAAPGTLRFCVADDGPGVSEADQARIFQKFTQADPEMSRRHGGVGLGLSIARELVEQMNGRIGVASTLGAGAQFWFELPSQPQSEESFPAATPTSAPFAPQPITS